jgi:hypothetical protein
MKEDNRLEGGRNLNSKKENTCINIRRNNLLKRQAKGGIISAAWWWEKCNFEIRREV